MTQGKHIVTVVGGSGFLGRYVIRSLVRAGYRVRVVSRNPEAALHLKTAADPGQIALVAGNITRPETLQAAVAGSYAVVNLVGALFEKKGQSFADLHAQGTANLAKAAKLAGAERFIHLSALGVEKIFGAEYARTKFLGEKSAQQAFPGATILRPSVIFGPEDNFFNMFAGMPFLPLIGGGKTRFQPVYANDVAAAITACIKQPDTAGQTYELGGNTTYSFRALLDYVRATLHIKKPFLRLSFPVAFIAAIGAEIAYKLIPLIKRPFITRDQLKMLKFDNVVNPGAKTFAQLGITPQPLELVVPHYLARFNPKKVI